MKGFFAYCLFIVCIFIIHSALKTLIPNPVFLRATFRLVISSIIAIGLVVGLVIKN